MCKKCNKKSCSGACSSNTAEAKSLADLKNQVQELSDVISDISTNAKFLLCGHPILMIQNADDIESFNMTTGLGSGCWANWAICNGDEQYSQNADKNITTPNLLDRFIVAAGNQYDVDDVGGYERIAITIGQMPVHSHLVNDNGHVHDIQETAHTHGITQTPHNHSASGGSHDHEYSGVTSVIGGHEHSTGVTQVDNGDAKTVRLADAAAGSSTSTEGSHSHTYSGTTGSASNSVTVGDASITISNNNALTGIDETEESTTGITLQEAGDDESHENRPPYYSLLFVMKL